MIGAIAADKENLRAFLAKVMRFGIVGISATALYFALAWSMHRAGLVVEVASLIAQIISLIYSYYAQKRFTFGVAGEHKRFGPRFFVATLAILASAQTLVWFLDEQGVAATHTLLINSIYYPAASFLVHTFWTFAKPDARRP
ncbi:MAG: GtrA family protein [Pseudomonadota bacterium]